MPSLIYPEIKLNHLGYNFYITEKTKFERRLWMNDTSFMTSYAALNLDRDLSIRK